MRTIKARKLPKFTPAPEAVVNRFHALLERLPEAHARKMFGYPCAFVNGQMLIGVFQDRIVLRLSDEDRARCLQLPDVRPFEPIPGRGWREYVELPPHILIRHEIHSTLSSPPPTARKPAAAVAAPHPGAGPA